MKDHLMLNLEQLCIELCLKISFNFINRWGFLEEEIILKDGHRRLKILFIFTQHC
jgi:hypothetical protein